MTRSPPKQAGFLETDEASAGSRPPIPDEINRGNCQHRITFLCSTGAATAA